MFDLVRSASFGQHRALKDGLYELKIDHGPGYRVYYTFKGRVLILLLCGGDKRSQVEDIKRALALSGQWEE